MTTDKISGQVSAHSRGFGFAETDEGERYFIPPALMKRLLPEDRITFTVESGRQPGEFQVGQLLALQRKSRVLLGELEVHGDQAVLAADEPCFLTIEVPNATAASGEVVAVRVPASESASRMIRGELIEVLGPRNRAGFDEDYALFKFGLSKHPTEATEREAGALDSQILSRIGQGWLDLRSIPFVTIDGESTRDIDDAVSAERCPAGYQLDVAIADVSAYVKPRSALAARAYERCTSVYLPQRTVPMLPETLSSDLGSLRAGVPRLALVCRMVVSPKGQILLARFERGVILSQARLTYAAVHARMSEGRPVGDNPKVEHSLEVLTDLYRVLAQARRDRGVLDFNEREPKLKTRADGELEIIWEERNDAHRMIEELMLLANQAAAEALLRRGAFGFYRHQALPLEEDWNDLREWLAEQGVSLPASQSIQELAKVLESVKGREGHSIIEARIRQVMQFAVYDNLSPGHFSLGFPAYTHFTSPLRRYSDLLVHRILLGENVPDEELKEAAERCSAMSRSARNAERFVWDRIKKRLLVRDVPQGAPLSSKVLFVSRRGLKVLIDDWQCTAFVPADTLASAGYHWEDKAQAWTGAGRLEPGSILKVIWQLITEEKGSCEITAQLI